MIVARKFLPRLLADKLADLAGLVRAEFVGGLLLYQKIPDLFPFSEPG